MDRQSVAIEMQETQAKPDRRFMSKDDRAKQCQSVLDLIEHEGISESAACNQVGIARSTFRQAVMKHISDADYARAMAVLAHHQVEKAEQSIADMRSGVLDAAQARVELDARKWFASKFLPKQYGDKVIQEVTGADGGSIKVEAINPLDVIEAKMAKLLEARKADK